MSTGIGSHTKPNRGQSNDWLTPPDLLKQLGPFDLDPCCPPTMPWSTADRMFHFGKEDGLKLAWEAKRVYVNPPYGTEAAAWLNRLAKHGAGTALIFARTETDMFFEHVWKKATAVLFIRGRLHFYSVHGVRAKGNSGGPSVLIAYGNADADRLKSSGIEGQFIQLRRA